MKKFWIVLLALGLIAAFSLPAAATDVKLSGYYLVQGFMESNRSLGPDGPSMAYYGQRIRMEPAFKVAEGLNFTMRIDMMERVWGQFAVGGEIDPAGIALNHRNRPTAQNIQIKRGWMDFITPVGMFIVGYRADGEYGTYFGDTPTEGPMILYILPMGQFSLIAGLEKLQEGAVGFTGNAAGHADDDGDRWFVAGRFGFPQGEVGALGMYVRFATNRPLSVAGQDIGFKLLDTYYGAVYFKTTFGPVYIEGEYANWWGDFIKYDNLAQAQAVLGAATQDIKLRSQQWYLMAKFNMGPAFVGAQYAYSSGDDPGTTDKNEAFPSPGYMLWQPCLILFEDWTNRWTADLGGRYGAISTELFTNATLYQVFAGYNPTPKLGFKTSVSYAVADHTPATYVDDVLGTEFDLSMTYKIYDNLEYMIGFGYLWAGDYFKGASDANVIDDDYLLMHQLKLSF